MATRGRPATINMDELERLCGMQATDAEIAAWFGVTTRTIERKRKEPAFAEVMERGKNKGRLTVRRAQLKMLEQGNATMAVWLGKQYLGQTDEIRHDLSLSPNLTFVLPREIETPRMPVSVRPQLGEEAQDDEEAVEIEPADYEAVEPDD